MLRVDCVCYAVDELGSVHRVRAGCFTVNGNFVVHVHQRLHECIVFADPLRDGIQGEHVAEVVLIEHVAAAGALEDAADEAVSGLRLRRGEVKRAPIADEVARVCVVFDVVDNAVWFLAACESGFEAVRQEAVAVGGLAERAVEVVGCVAKSVDFELGRGGFGQICK